MLGTTYPAVKFVKTSSRYQRQGEVARLMFSELRGGSLPLRPCDQAIEFRIGRVHVVEKTIKLPRGFVQILLA
jgi:hypothetical protein